jgi:hypothetical protein
MSLKDDTSRWFRTFLRATGRGLLGSLWGAPVGATIAQLVACPVVIINPDLQVLHSWMFAVVALAIAAPGTAIAGAAATVSGNPTLGLTAGALGGGLPILALAVLLWPYEDGWGYGLPVLGAGSILGSALVGAVTGSVARQGRITE